MGGSLILQIEMAGSANMPRLSNVEFISIPLTGFEIRVRTPTHIRQELNTKVFGFTHIAHLCGKSMLGTTASNHDSQITVLSSPSAGMSELLDILAGEGGSQGG